MKHQSDDRQGFRRLNRPELGRLDREEHRRWDYSCCSHPMLHQACGRQLVSRHKNYHHWIVFETKPCESLASFLKDLDS